MAKVANRWPRGPNSFCRLRLSFLSDVVKFSDDGLDFSSEKVVFVGFFGLIGSKEDGITWKFCRKVHKKQREKKIHFIISFLHGFPKHLIKIIKSLLMLLRTQTNICSYSKKHPEKNVRKIQKKKGGFSLNKRLKSSSATPPEVFQPEQ